MRTAFVFVLLLAAAAFDRTDGRAQHAAWEQIYDRPSNIVKAIEMFDDEYGLALTGPGVLRTVDGGRTWAEPQGKPLIATGEIGSASRDVAWVATWSGGIWRTEDAGVTWTQQPSNTTTHLTSLAVIDENEAWIAGRGEGFSDVVLPVSPPSVLLHTRNGGQTWRSVSVPEFGTFVEVEAAGNRLWLVATKCNPGDATAPGFPQPDSVGCDDHNVLLRSDDGGQTWDDLGDQAVGEPVSSQPPSALQFIDEEDGFGVISTCDGGACGSTLVATEDGGETWAVRSSPLATIVPEVRFFGVSEGWAAHLECDETGIDCSKVVLATTDGGRTWIESHRIAESVAGGLTSAFDVNERDVVIADGETGIARAPVAGGAFAQAETPARPGINHPVFTTRDVGFTSTYPGLRKTVDGGLTWAEVATPETLGETAITESALWSLPHCGVVCPEYVYRSVDGGVSWERKQLPPGIQVFAVQAVDAEHAWAQGLNATWRTTDGGATWQATNAAMTTLQPQFVTAEFGWSRSCAVQPCNANFALTPDGGMTFEDRPLPNGSSDIGFFMDASTGWASSYESNADRSLYRTRIWRTLDGAGTWEDMGVPAVQVSLNNAVFIDADRGWSIGYPLYDEEGMSLGPQTIVATVDGGRTWTPEYTFEQTIFGGGGSFSSAEDRLWVTSSITDNPWSFGRSVLFRREGIERQPVVVPPTTPDTGEILPPDTGSGGYR